MKIGLANFRAVIAALALTGGAGCSSLHPQRATSTAPSTPVVATAIPAPSRQVLKNTPSHRPSHWRKWNPVFWFGNLDDPAPPDWYRPDDPRRDGKWYCRNSLHNFTFYVMGIADKEFEYAGRYPSIYNPNEGWNWTVCRYKCVRLPLISYKKGGILFYCGWRERGNFGMKLSFKKSRVKSSSLPSRWSESGPLRQKNSLVQPKLEA